MEFRVFWEGSKASGVNCLEMGRKEGKREGSRSRESRGSKTPMISRSRVLVVAKAALPPGHDDSSDTLDSW